MKRVLWALWTVVALMQAVPASAQQSVADFYRGKKLTLLIGYTAAGAYDLYARALARHMGDHIPGNPTILPQNMPGAGSLVLANYLYNVAPKDGTVFATFARGMAMEPLIGGGKAQFDSRKFTWLGSATDEISVCATTQFSKVHTYQDMLTTEFSVGGEGGGSDPDTFAAVAKNLLGAKIKIVTGYPGGNEITLAIERGELDGRCGWSWTSIKSTKPDWIRDKKLNLLLLMGLHRSAELPDVPTILEKAKNDREVAIMKLIFTRQTLGRPFVAPPNLPEDRKQALLKAFDETMKDPAFLADAKQLGLEISPVDGAAVDKIVNDLYATPPNILEETHKLINGGAN